MAADIDFYDHSGYSIWTTADGTRVPVECLSDSHIENILKMVIAGKFTFMDMDDEEQWEEALREEQERRTRLDISVQDRGSQDNLLLIL